MLLQNSVFAAEIRKVGNQAGDAPTRAHLRSHCASALDIKRSHSLGNFLMFFAWRSHQMQNSSLLSPAFLCNSSLQGSSLCKAPSAPLLVSKQQFLLRPCVEKPATEFYLWPCGRHWMEFRRVLGLMTEVFFEGGYVEAGKTDGVWFSARLGQVGLELLVQLSVE